METIILIIWIRWTHYQCVYSLNLNKTSGKMIKQNREQIKSEAKEAWQNYLNETQPSRRKLAS